ncbi:MAG TPA: GAF domain-containing protein, partial [Vicinamibacterales bacterium]|nr:GAF domain-containing protein [Vicinamibacterales bacterium]
MHDRLSHTGATLALTQELADMQLLQELSSELIAEQRIDSLYDRVAAAAACLMRSDFASMQMLHAERNGGELRLLAHRGFTPEAADCWRWVGHDTASSCGAAMRAGQRIVIHDIEQCDFLAGTANLDAYRDAGIRAAQSTPLFDRDGQLVGMLSTHWRGVHGP